MWKHSCICIRVQCNTDRKLLTGTVKYSMSGLVPGFQAHPQVMTWPLHWTPPSKQFALELRLQVMSSCSQTVQIQHFFTVTGLEKSWTGETISAAGVNRVSGFVYCTTCLGTQFTAWNGVYIGLDNSLVVSCYVTSFSDTVIYTSV